MKIILSWRETDAYEREVHEECVKAHGFQSHLTRLTLPERLHFASPQIKQALIRTLDRADARVAVGLGDRFEASYWRQRQRRPQRRRPARRAVAGGVR